MSGRPMIVICLAWAGVCTGLYAVWRIFPGHPGRGFDYLSIGACLYTAVRITRVYLGRIEPRFHARRFLRIKWAAGGILAWLGLYGLAVWGWGSNLLAGVLTLDLLLLAAMAGAWLAGHLKRPPEIVPLAVTAGLADMFSIAKGPTRVFSEQISDYYRGGMEGVPPLVDFLMVKFPMPGHPAFMPVFGVTDWIVLAFLSAAALKFGMTDNLWPERYPAGNRGAGYFPAACAGLAVAVVLAREFSLFLPALPFAVVAYLLVMLPRCGAMRDLTRAEILPMIGVSALMIGLMILL